jgi:enamine deaminase RidA (YjgF/YER057c/UK114 family)
MSSLSWRPRAPTGSTAETYRSMGWNNRTRPWIGGHFRIWRGNEQRVPPRAGQGAVGSAGEGHKFRDDHTPSCSRETVGPMREILPVPSPGLDLHHHYGHHQSAAIRAGGLIFCSGMVAVNPETGEREQIMAWT